jgi:uncharacterized phage protein gp47/JayE
MALSRPTLQEIIDAIVADFKANISGATTLSLRSVLRVIARTFAGACHLIYGYADNIVQATLFATTATTSFLDTMGSEFGVLRNAAVAATGNGTATGTTGTAIPAGSELKAADDTRYTTDAEVTLAGGTGTLALTAKVAAEAGNEVAGATLTFVSPIVGVNSTVTVDSGALTGGADEEEDDDYRARILARKRQAPHGGAEFDYTNWALEVSGVTRAWTIPLYQGAGTLALLFVRDDDSGSIFPDAAEIATVEAYLISHEDPQTGLDVGMPVTAQPGLFVLAPTPKTINFDIDLEPNTAAVQATVTAEIEDLFTRDAGPGETIPLSNVGEAISLATGEEKHKINSPVADIGASTSELQVLGTITFNAY